MPYHKDWLDDYSGPFESHKGIDIEHLNSLWDSCGSNMAYPNWIITSKRVLEKVDRICIHANAFWELPWWIRWMAKPILKRYWKIEQRLYDEKERSDHD